MRNGESHFAVSRPVRISKGQDMKKTTFRVSKMDCPSEEQMIRMRLGEFQNVYSMQFDIPDRRLDVYHTEDYKPIFEALDELG